MIPDQYFLQFTKLHLYYYQSRCILLKFNLIPPPRCLRVNQRSNGVGLLTQIIVIITIYFILILHLLALRWLHHLLQMRLLLLYYHMLTLHNLSNRNIQHIDCL